MSNYSDSHFDESNQNTSWYKVYKFIKPKSKVLDVGCSSGNFGEVLISRSDCLVDGIEPDKEDAKEARKKLNKVWEMNIETDNLDKLPKGYDYIYFGDVIEHLVNPVQTLRRIKPLLKNTGAVAFSIPNMGHVGVRIAILKGQFEYTETGLTDKTHFHFYTKDEVERIFNEAGYEIDILDFVQKDYPKELLRKEFKKIGLEASNIFLRKMSGPDASAFQFVGLAKPSKATTRKLKKFGPIDLFEKFYEDTKVGYEQRIEQLETQLSELNNRLSHKETHPYRSIASHAKRKASGLSRKRSKD